MGAHSLCIKDMAGLLQPYVAYDLVKKLKKAIDIPIQLHAHATTGLSTATLIKAIEAGIDRVDTSIASMSMTYGHSSTNAVVSILDHGPRKTGIDMEQLEEIDAYFRTVRPKYAKFEGSLKGIDPRILLAQVPGGMLTNMESQLRENNALDRLDEVLKEIPRVREDLGYIPLVTPTSQIVGTQAVMNVLLGERYKSIAKESAGILKGEYGASPAPVNAELQARVLDGGEAITCRPADNIDPEMDTLEAEFDAIIAEKGIKLENEKIDDLLIYILFPQVGIQFLENRNNPDFFEPVPQPPSEGPKEDGVYTVKHNGQDYVVEVKSGGEISSIQVAGQAAAPQAAPKEAPQAAAPAVNAEDIPAPLAGNIWKVLVSPNQQVNEGDTLVILEAMKMETEVKAARAGTVVSVNVSEGDQVSAGQAIISLA
mgnify:FL=1